MASLKELALERMARRGEAPPPPSHPGPPSPPLPHQRQPATPASPTPATSSATESAREEFDCSLCLKLFLEPISLPCGHTFCRTCLTRAVTINHYCPMCRTPTFITPRDAPPSYVLAKAIQKLYPADYATRLEEEREEEAELGTVHVPLFIHPGVPFPGEPVQLFFFENKYLVLANTALQGSRKFGYLETPESMVGVLVDVLDAARAEDGKLHIRGKAYKRFNLVDAPAEVPDSGGLLAATASLFDDDTLADDPHSAEALAERQTLSTLRNALSTTMTRMMSTMAQHEVQALQQLHGAMPVEAVQLSFYLASVLNVSKNDKEAMLATRSTVDRLQIVYNHLQRLDDVARQAGPAYPGTEAPMAPAAGAGAGGSRPVVPLTAVHARNALRAYVQPSTVFTRLTSSPLLMVALFLIFLYWVHQRYSHHPHYLLQ